MVDGYHTTTRTAVHFFVHDILAKLLLHIDSTRDALTQSRTYARIQQASSLRLSRFKRCFLIAIGLHVIKCIPYPYNADADYETLYHDMSMYADPDATRSSFQKMQRDILNHPLPPSDPYRPLCSRCGERTVQANHGEWCICEEGTANMDANKPLYGKLLAHAHRERGGETIGER